MDIVTCNEVTPDDFQLLLYTRTNAKSPIPLNITNPELNVKKDTVFIAHSWLQSSNGYGIDALKNAYLEHGDYNVIIINWGKISLQLYSGAVCQLPKLANILADFVCSLHSKEGVQLENIHLLGHGLGAHLMGYIGQSTNTTCSQKIGRITGLDPSGLFFVDTPRSNRLDSTDANFVQVVHTNGGMFGFLGKCGHADFFANCGSIQRSCNMQEGVYKIIGLLPSPYNKLISVYCYHMRAIDLWIEAINSDKLQAYPCAYCPLGCPPIFSFYSTKTTMGETCPKEARGGFYLPTNSNPPYATTSMFG